MSEEIEANAEIFWANYMLWRPLMKIKGLWKLGKLNFLHMDVMDDPKESSWVIVGHKAFQGKAWVKASRFRKLRATKH